MKIREGFLPILIFLGFLWMISCSSNQEQAETPTKTSLEKPQQAVTNKDGDLVLSSTSRTIAKKHKEQKIIKGYLMMTNEIGSEVPVPAKDIVLQDDDYQEIARVKTGKSGYFQFSLDIPMGDYSLIYDEGTYHRVFTLSETEADFGTLNINPRFD